MNQWNSYEAYRENEILSASPLELVCILYRGALDCVANARQALRNGEIGLRSNEISKAIAILDELSTSLDASRGADLTRSLAELYDYMQRRLILANTRQSDPELAEVESLLSTLLEAWTECAANSGAEGPPVDSDAGYAVISHY